MDDRALAALTSAWWAWSAQLGTYKLECIAIEDPRDTFTVRVLENGTELYRTTIVQDGPEDWEKVHNETDALRARFWPRFIAKLLER